MQSIAPKSSVNAVSSRLSARTILVALAAVFAALAIAPHLPSATPTGATTFTQTNLVSDVPGMARTLDVSLVNPWGMALGLNSGIWIPDKGSGRATTYDGTGQPIPSGAPQLVTILAPGNSGGKSSPTGVATNDTSGFVISAGAASGPSVELFATEDGTIAGWNVTVDAARAVTAVDNSAA